MPIGLAFYILLLIWLVFGIASLRGFGGPYGLYGNSILLFVLFLLLGWAQFGAPIR